MFSNFDIAADCLNTDFEMCNNTPQCSESPQQEAQNWRDAMDTNERFRLVEELFERMIQKNPTYNYALLAQETAEIVETSWNMSSSMEDFYSRIQSWGEKRKRPRPVEWTQKHSYGMSDDDEEQDPSMMSSCEANTLIKPIAQLGRAASSPSMFSHQMCARESASGNGPEMRRQTKRIRVALDL